MNPTIVPAAPEVESQPQPIVAHPYLGPGKSRLPLVVVECTPVDVQDPSTLSIRRPTQADTILAFVSMEPSARMDATMAVGTWIVAAVEPRLSEKG